MYSNNKWKEEISWIMKLASTSSTWDWWFIQNNSRLANLFLMIQDIQRGEEQMMVLKIPFTNVAFNVTEQLINSDAMNQLQIKLIQYFWMTKSHHLKKTLGFIQRESRGFTTFININIISSPNLDLMYPTFFCMANCNGNPTSSVKSRILKKSTEV